jgi:hypothetical protein
MSSRPKPGYFRDGLLPLPPFFKDERDERGKKNSLAPSFDTVAGG